MLKSTGTTAFTRRSQIAPLPGHACVFMHAWLLLGWHSKNTARMNRSEGILAGSTIWHTRNVPPFPPGRWVMHEFGRPAFFGKSMENVCWASTRSGQANANRSRIAAQDSSVIRIGRVVVYMVLSLRGDLLPAGLEDLPRLARHDAAADAALHGAAEPGDLVGERVAREDDNGPIGNRQKARDGLLAVVVRTRSPGASTTRARTRRRRG